MISLEQINAGWDGGRGRAVEDFDLELVRGQTLAIVGPGGSGKSTLLQLLDHLVNPNIAGSRRDSMLWWTGTAEVTISSCARLVQYGSFSGEPVSSVIDRVNLDIDAELGPLAAELEPLSHHSLARLSDPLRRYLSFMLVATADDELLLFDEPLFELPAPWPELISRRLRALADRGRTVVVVTHYLPLARSISDRVALLVDGRLIEIAATERFFRSPNHARTRDFVEYGG